ncbi:hypothetical protein GW17_00032766 [Ensete ventricosum]|nr:hypothetical protein GW17_00032766 [Ensete ventricosum]
MEEAPERGYTLWELCEVEDRVGAESYFATVMTQLKVAEGEDPLMPRWSAIAGCSQFWTEGPIVENTCAGLCIPPWRSTYKCSSEELMNRASKSTVWGLHCTTTLIDRVHDAGRLVRSQHERILALRAANKELKGLADQDLVAIVESHVKELEGDVNKLRGSWKGDVLSLTEAATLLETELKGEGAKAVAAYKASRGFESGLEKMGQVSCEFGYRVTLERLQGKHPEIEVEQDPFAECPKDANAKIDLSQPFDGSSPSKK